MDFMTERHDNKGNCASETFGNPTAKTYSGGRRPDAAAEGNELLGPYFTVVTDGTAYEQTVSDTTKQSAALTNDTVDQVPRRPPTWARRLNPAATIAPPTTNPATDV
jgi:hypothetical protein